MQVNTNHSAFKDSTVFFGNACTPHQESVYFSVSDRMPTHGVVDEENGKLYVNTPKGRWYGTTKEQLTKQNLGFLKRYVSQHLFDSILNAALASGSICAGIIRSNGKKYGFFVMNEFGKVIAYRCMVNHYKARDLVDEFIKTLQLDNQKCTQGQIDYVVRRLGENIEASEVISLKARLAALEVELGGINEVLYS